MKLVSFINENNTHIGALKENYITPFSSNPDIPRDMLTFLQNGDEFFELAKNLLEYNEKKIPLEDCKLTSPIKRPPKIIAIGLNYQDHLEEIRLLGRDVDDPEVPMIFNKQSTSVCGPYDSIHDPFVSEKLDYELSLVHI